jgi:trk system potassium uptake protein TrkH
MLLRQDFSVAGGAISWVDALFTATSAVCVTGLIVVDTGSFFTQAGQTVILALIQLGGLGIMTYTSLVFYLWRRRVSLADRIAVGQSLLHEPSFNLGTFLIQVIALVLSLEVLGCLALLILGGGEFSLYWSLFHAVSAFCNAGFSLQAESLIPWREDVGVNMTFMLLIVLGGLGFSVLLELMERTTGIRIKNVPRHGRRKLSWHGRIVIKTSIVLLVLGTVGLLVSEFLFQGPDMEIEAGFMASLFQSVTARTAGFNTVDIGSLANVSLLILIFLMFIGGSPGSCAGGIKTTTLAALWAFAKAQIRGRRQSVAGKFALDLRTMNKALTLIFFAIGIVTLAVLALSFSEGLARAGPEPRGLFLEILFEVVSAFGTVGLSTGITPSLSPPGKVIVTVVMFVGRLGPIMFLSALREFQRRENFSWPENSLLIG